MTESDQGDATLPPRSSWPNALQELAYLTRGRWLVKLLVQRLGSTFSMRLPVFGPAVMMSDPALIRELFKLPVDVLSGAEPNLGMVFGSGSTFGLQGVSHRQRRKLLLPVFQGDRMRAYEQLIEQETLAETATWPEGKEFEVLPSMMRITMMTIIRAVYGVNGTELDDLSTLLPRLMRAGQKLALAPWLQRDFGLWSPWGRFLVLRREFDVLVENLIARAVDDPDLSDRGDVLAQLVGARGEGGAAMSSAEICDELLTFVVAGHETTATSLSWAIERLRRHPDVLARLAEEVDRGGSDLLQATVYELHRVRPVIGAVARHVIADSISLGPWVIPRGHTIAIAIESVHRNKTAYEDPDKFNPDRFMGRTPDSGAWVPFGGGSRRCPGASFANMEIQVVLRTLLRQFRIVPTTAPDERWHMRGVAFAPSRGGRAVVYRRREDAAPSSIDCESVAPPSRTGRRDT